MKIYILRHAWAGEHGDPRWPNDDLRPLSPEGEQRFERCAKKLAQLGIAPAVIATSPLVRCRQTAEILASRLEPTPNVVNLPALAPGARLELLLRWTQSQGQAEVAWVGHAPDVSQLTARLIGGGSAAIRFPKGACAEVRFEGPLAPGRGELAALVTAKMLGY